MKFFTKNQRAFDRYVKFDTQQNLRKLVEITNLVFKGKLDILNIIVDQFKMNYTYTAIITFKCSTYLIITHHRQSHWLAPGHSTIELMP